MTKNKQACGHPRMCPDESFADKIKSDKLALTPPPLSPRYQPPDK